MKVNSLMEVLLTTWALSMEPAGKVVLKDVFPPRLMSALRTARKRGMVEVDDRGVYLSDEGGAYLNDHAPGVQL